MVGFLNNPSEQRLGRPRNLWFRIGGPEFSHCRLPALIPRGLERGVRWVACGSRRASCLAGSLGRRCGEFLRGSVVRPYRVRVGRCLRDLEGL